MAGSTFRTVLVIGDNHEDLIKEYSFDTKVEPYLYLKKSDAHKAHEDYIRQYSLILSSRYGKGEIDTNSVAYQTVQERYKELMEMSDEEFFEEMTDGCTIDENGDAYSTKNQKAKYRAERCYEERYKKTGEEAPFSNPMVLKNLTKSYSARFDDIEWAANHMFGTDLYRRAWEIVMEGSEPKTEQEKNIKERMGNRQAYFKNFADADEYVRHSCSFWCYGVITQDGEYHEVGNGVSDKDWVAQFFDKYIKPIKGNPLLTIYEVRKII